jgi:hypothetical protein
MSVAATKSELPRWAGVSVSFLRPTMPVGPKWRGGASLTRRLMGGGGPAGYSATGSVTAKLVPSPGVLSTATEPSIASASSLTIASPRPVPTARFFAYLL